MAAAEQLTELEVLSRQVAGCTRCRLHEGRTQVVFGNGNPEADLMFVGEAPGFHEDKQGLPFVGQAGKLLDKLLAGIGLTRADVFVCNVLKCRPPGNRDPVPDEKEACEPYLFRQVELIRPKVVATLGNHATKQLSGKETGITRVHGQEQRLKVGSLDVVLYPLYHPAAALYTPAMLTVLEEDFARLPELLGRTIEPVGAAAGAGAGRGRRARSSARPLLAFRDMLAEYQPGWAERFATEAALLREALGDVLVEIEHVGSTAVPGLAAKPTIDIAAGTTTLDLPAAAVERLRTLGFEDAGDDVFPGERRFRKGAGVPWEVIVHVVEWGGPMWRDSLRFRDALRADPSRAQEYEALKRRLLEERGDWYHGVDKQELIQRVLAAAPEYRFVRSSSPGETEAIAAQLASVLRAGDVVTVSGELGSGKTTFVRGACRALGVTGAVTSPTFTIGHRYDGRPGRLPPRPLPLPGLLRGRVGRPRAVLSGRDLLRRVARGGGRRAAAGASRGTFVAHGSGA